MHGGWLSAVYHPGVDLLDYIHDERCSDRPVPAMVSTLVIGDGYSSELEIDSHYFRPPSSRYAIHCPNSTPLDPSSSRPPLGPGYCSTGRVWGYPV